MRTFSRAATAVALSLALATPLAIASTATAADVRRAAPASGPSASAPVAPAAIELPRPTGPYALGSDTLHLVDHSRRDPWVPSQDRELMVTLTYPAERPGAGRAAAYTTAAEAPVLLRQLGVDPARLGDVEATTTHARAGVRPARGRHPLIVLSPGFGAPRYSLTTLAEELASKGYVVASLDHAYESVGTSFPGGRLLTCVACTAMENGAPGSRVTEARAADVSFLLDRLTGTHPAWRHARSIDPSRIGMAGHSIGGAAAVAAMVRDARIGAGVNMDGAFWDVLPPGGLGGRPFMMLGTDDATHRPGGEDRTWDAMWPTLDGWKRWLTVAGAEHMTFSDEPVLAAHFGLPQTSLPAGRAVSVVRTYVAAFFDQELLGRARPVLAGPTAANPEVRFNNP
ncbi:alpha/beta hydrolase [Streptomyces sp. NBC_00083]|uniref:alpha/beta hydrolase family protein n=1 Tax=Streptomyces sp. NBC_00083 TaxID=2975647 RepID=UPI00224C7CB1|nr:alpha/beta hydrolase [Streptomyces sp. NBC_00083]MCX5386423.1 alpha/beta hydrolase [Streptomyces sp. NBC_00083]